ncbi:PssD/Cps14F family polysaccharide biosynthesis glycosyltransferase [Neobacillus niacini]|uniref:PssD/Cps14F family polysaccharide biosynthesis glycosyltransferase n=1 Tax=Neobacillus niacini TaxID=86668 RepID=UPI0007ABF670|nr:PssD/Cps14F family polysaccharide biosynthesis glycosyltransferase [Neobacillus niacini]
MTNKAKKVFFVSSSGGHLAQLKHLSKFIMNKYTISWVIEKNLSTQDLENEERVFFLKHQDRRMKGFLFVFIYNILKSLMILIKVRPDIVITTGAGAVIPICYMAKLLGSKIVFIESYAKINSPTLTGRFIYKIADEFYVQWEELLHYYPEAKFRGSIY